MDKTRRKTMRFQLKNLTWCINNIFLGSILRMFVGLVYYSPAHACLHILEVRVFRSHFSKLSGCFFSSLKEIAFRHREILSKAEGLRCPHFRPKVSPPRFFEVIWSQSSLHKILPATTKNAMAKRGSLEEGNLAHASHDALFFLFFLPQFFFQVKDCNCKISY